MRKYELMFIVRPDLEEKDIKTVADDMKKVIVDMGSKVVDAKDMGQRDLAYEIKKHAKGYYFLFTIESNDDKAIKEFDRLALINENIIRHLVVRVDN